VAQRSGVDATNKIRILLPLGIELCAFFPQSIAVPKELSRLSLEMEIGIQNSSLELEDK
jgi:hypothetical protein